MKKISNRTLNVINNYLLSELKTDKISLDNFNEMMEILSSKISGLVTDIEDNNNKNQCNTNLLKEFDYAFDELNETDEIDFFDLNNRIKN